MKNHIILWKKKLTEEINELGSRIAPSFGNYVPTHAEAVEIFNRLIEYDPYDYKSVILESEYYAQVNARRRMFIKQKKWINKFQKECNLFYLNDIINHKKNKALLSHSFFHFYNVAIAAEAILRSFACELNYYNYCRLMGGNLQLKKKDIKTAQF